MNISDDSESFNVDSLVRDDSNITSGNEVDFDPNNQFVGPSLSQFSLISGDFRDVTNAGILSDYDHVMADLIQKLPSRQLENVADLAARTLLRKKRIHPYRVTIRLNRDDSLEEDIIDSIDQDIQSSVDMSEYLDEAVRTFPTTLSKKRNIKRKMLTRMKKPEKGFPLFKYRLLKLFRLVKFKWRRLTRFLNVWRSHLLTIEGSFGTSVVSYFIFLKWVLLINVPVFLFMFFFLVIPQTMYIHYHNIEVNKDVSFSLLHLFTGEGVFENSEMYYGYYTNHTVEIIPGHSYQMKYVYLWTTAGYYLLCFIILGYSYLRSYRIYYIESGGPAINCYFNLFVSGWDYGITSEETSEFKHKSLYNEFKENLSGKVKQEVRLDKDKRIRIGLIRMMTWSLVVGLLTISGYLTLLISKKHSINKELHNVKMNYSKLRPLAVPFVISTIQLIVPMAFSFLESFEEYRLPKDELYVHMFRAMALKATILAVLCYFWLSIARFNIKLGRLITFRGKCWETYVGEEIYRLVIIDLMFMLGYSFFMEYIRKLCSRQWKQIKRAEFAIGKHTLDLIYSQALCWLGLFYAPLLPLVVILKLIVIFYVKRFSVMNNCIPSVKPWRASRTHTIFVGYLFIFFILCCLPVGYSIFLIKPSGVCGPYQNRTTIYEMITHDLISKWKKESEAVKMIFEVIDSPGFVAGLLIFLFMILYYTRTISLSHKAMVEQLKLQLISEGKDKKFLINLLNQVKIKGHKQDILHPGPVLQKALADYSSPAPMKDAHGGKIFIRTVADNILNVKKSNTPR